MLSKAVGIPVTRTHAWCVVPLMYWWSTFMLWRKIHTNELLNAIKMAMIITCQVIDTVSSPEINQTGVAQVCR